PLRQTAMAAQTSVVHVALPDTELLAFASLKSAPRLKSVSRLACAYNPSFDAPQNEASAYRVAHQERQVAFPKARRLNVNATSAKYRSHLGLLRRSVGPWRIAEKGRAGFGEEVQERRHRLS